MSQLKKFKNADRSIQGITSLYTLHLPCISKGTCSWFKNISVGKQSMDIIYYSPPRKKNIFLLHPLMRTAQGRAKYQLEEPSWGVAIWQRQINLATTRDDGTFSPPPHWVENSLTAGAAPVVGCFPPTQASGAPGVQAETLWPTQVGLGNRPSEA